MNESRRSRICHWIYMHKIKTLCQMRRITLSTSDEQRKVQKAFKDNSLHYKAINRRINKFRQEQKVTINSAKEIEWKKLSLTLQYEEKEILRDIESISKQMNHPRTYFMNSKMFSSRLETTASHVIEGEKGEPIQEKRKRLEALRVELASEFDIIDNEANVLKKDVRGNDKIIKNNAVALCQSCLPAVLTKRLDDIKKEFKFVRDLESDIEIVTKQLEDNFKQSFNHQVWKRREASRMNNKDHDNATKWDERSQMVLRNAIKQWSNNPTNHDKQIFLQDVAKETGNNDIKACRQMWNFYLSQKGRGNGKKEKERQNNELIIMAMEDINKMRQDIIHELVSNTQKQLNNEIGIESHHRLWLYQRLRALSEQMNCDDERRLQLFQNEEQCLSLSKKQSEMEAARPKLEDYLKGKEDKTLQARMKKTEMMEKGKVVRAQRNAINSERTQFRYELIKTRAEVNQRQKEESARKQLLRDQCLNALAASVPYHSTIKNIKSNIQKSTASRMNDIFEPCSDTGLSEFQIGKMTGFTNERVFSDPKFRLGFALHEKGLATSAYSVAVVKRLIPREAERTTGIEPH